MTEEASKRFEEMATCEDTIEGTVREFLKWVAAGPVWSSPNPCMADLLVEG